MKYIVVGKSSEEMIWMGEADSPEEAVKTALAFTKCLASSARLFKALPIVGAKDIQEKALEWANGQPDIETPVEAIFGYAKEIQVHVDWTNYQT